MKSLVIHNTLIVQMSGMIRIKTKALTSGLEFKKHPNLYLKAIDSPF